jgi:hypothetical protein
MGIGLLLVLLFLFVVVNTDIKDCWVMLKKQQEQKWVDDECHCCHLSLQYYYYY